MDAKDLPQLTPKQLKFVKGLLEGKTYSDAYRGAYNTQNWSDEAIWVEASRLKDHPNVSLWLAKAREAQAESVIITREWWNRTALKAMKRAEQDGSHTAVKGFMDSFARVNGLHSDDGEQRAENVLANALARFTLGTGDMGDDGDNAPHAFDVAENKSTH